MKCNMGRNCKNSLLFGFGTSLKKKKCWWCGSVPLAGTGFSLCSLLTSISSVLLRIAQRFYKEWFDVLKHHYQPEARAPWINGQVSEPRQEIHKKKTEYSAGSGKKELKTNKMEERQRRKRPTLGGKFKGGCVGGFLMLQGSSVSRGGGLQPLGLYRASLPAGRIKLHAASGFELPSLRGQNK